MKFLNDNTPPLSQESLAAFLHATGVDLPTDYQNFLLMHNGGIPEHRGFFIPDCGGEMLIDYFLGINRHREDLADWMHELRDDLKDSYLPIAFDQVANTLLLDREDGHIYYWDSGRHFPTSTDEENAFWVADSFSALLETLRR